MGVEWAETNLFESRRKQRIEIPIWGSIFNPLVSRNDQKILKCRINILDIKDTYWWKTLVFRFNSDAMIFLIKIIILLQRLCKTKCIENELWDQSFCLMFLKTSTIKFLVTQCIVTNIKNFANQCSASFYSIHTINKYECKLIINFIYY